MKYSKNIVFRAVATCVVVAFLTTTIIPRSYAQMNLTQTSEVCTGCSVLNLPVPGTFVFQSDNFQPALVKGLTIHPENPLLFDFIVNTGDTGLQGDDLKVESNKLIKYFLASLTVPEDQVWVNLSPYEKDRVIGEGLRETEMGRDMLAQDYMLKQLTASLMYPEEDLGEEFWARVYEKAYARFGSTDIPMNTFNKIWIVPEKAVVYEHEETSSVYVLESHLKVMLEEDYVALQKNLGVDEYGLDSLADNEAEVISGVSSEVVREILIPEIEKEINQGEIFSNLRQIYHSAILASWYKSRLKDGLLGQVYVDQNKTKGIDMLDTQINQKIYDQYVESFKKGVYDFIREDYDPVTQQIIPRKYFSGGKIINPSTVLEVDFSLTADDQAMIRNDEVVLVQWKATEISQKVDAAQLHLEEGSYFFGEISDSDYSMLGRDMMKIFFSNPAKYVKRKTEDMINVVVNLSYAAWAYVKEDDSWGKFLILYERGRRQQLLKERLKFALERHKEIIKEHYDSPDVQQIIYSERDRYYAFQHKAYKRYESEGLLIGYENDDFFIKTGNLKRPELQKTLLQKDIFDEWGENDIEMVINAFFEDSERWRKNFEEKVKNEVEIVGKRIEPHIKELESEVADVLDILTEKDISKVNAADFFEELKKKVESVHAMTNINKLNDIKNELDKKVRAAKSSEKRKVKPKEREQLNRKVKEIMAAYYKTIFLVEIGYKEKGDLEMKDYINAEINKEINPYFTKLKSKLLDLLNKSFQPIEDLQKISDAKIDFTKYPRIRTKMENQGKSPDAINRAIIKRYFKDLKNEVKELKEVALKKDPNAINLYDIEKQFAEFVKKETLFKVVYDAIYKVDEAMLVDFTLDQGGEGMDVVAERVGRTKKTGGINLNPALLDLQIKRDGRGIPLPMEFQPIGDMRIEGFLPIILNVSPVSLPLLLGFANSLPEENLLEWPEEMITRDPIDSRT